MPELRSREQGAGAKQSITGFLNLDWELIMLLKADLVSYCINLITFSDRFYILA